MTAEAPEVQETSEETSAADQAIADLHESVSDLPFDDFTRIVVAQIVSGLEQVYRANEILLEDDDEDSETSVRNIDKKLKEFVAPVGTDEKPLTDEQKAQIAAKKAENKTVFDAANKAAEAYRKYRALQEQARNVYRTEVLGVEEKKETQDVDKEAIQAQRGLVVQSVTLLKQYAEVNPALSDFVRWADTLEIPQVGRKGVSTVGQKKPRARVTVTVGDKSTVHENFGAAAKHVSTELSKNGDKVEVTAGDLTDAWVDAGEPESFEYNGLTLSVQKKKTQKEEKAAA